MKRIGQIVPSSNTTMETEIPKILRAREKTHPDERFTFHSSRMRMKKVTKEELEAMDGDSLRCASELADAAVDVVGYACLVAIMSMGRGYHATSKNTLESRMKEEGHAAPVVTSAGALVEELQLAGIRSVSIVTPYMPPLTALVVDYIKDQGINVIDSIALSISDNLEVGQRDPMALINDVDRLNTEGADLVVLSACVQMPSLEAIQVVEDKIGMPVTSAAACTTKSMLRALDLDPVAPDAGFILSKASGGA
ncbi:Asp/Glu racemase [Parasphingorhabdus sp.]|uniref:maleate cis-trans isomerase family protein n=1 Tax=Parasphingorhabdus sp. TaxID=2709688 RepID=UPI003A9044D0